MNATSSEKMLYFLGAALMLQRLHGTHTAAALLADSGVQIEVALDLLASGPKRQLMADRLWADGDGKIAFAHITFIVS